MILTKEQKLSYNRIYFTIFLYQIEHDRYYICDNALESDFFKGVKTIHDS